MGDEPDGPRAETPWRTRVAAVIVTYEPDLDRLRAVLGAVVGQVGEVVVVDNGSSSAPEIGDALAAFRNTELVLSGENRGIGAALNVGTGVLRERAYDWILTLDQDTLVFPGALGALLDAYGRLPPPLHHGVGVLAMSRARASPHGRRQWVEQSLTLAELDEFVERRSVITSGNLVKAEVLDAVSYAEDFFMDQVDTKFCADVRRVGRSVLVLREPTMEHRLGTSIEVRGKVRVYEPGQRLYYIARNAFSLVLRRDLAVRVFLRDTIGLSRVYVTVHGRASMLRCARIVLTGLSDAVVGRFGRREYAFIARGEAVRGGGTGG